MLTFLSVATTQIMVPGLICKHFVCTAMVNNASHLYFKIFSDRLLVVEHAYIMGRASIQI